MNPTARLAAAAAAACLGVAACTGTDPTPGTAPTATPTPGPSSPTTSVPPTSFPPTPAPTPERSKSALEMTPEEAMYALINGEISLDEYCARDTFLTSGDTQMCYYHRNPPTYVPPDYTDVPLDYGAIDWRYSPTRFRFATHAEAYGAWQQGMPYYAAFCLNYVPVSSGGISQCEGIQAGTVDAYTGEYIGP